MEFKDPMKREARWDKICKTSGLEKRKPERSGSSSWGQIMVNTSTLFHLNVGLVVPVSFTRGQGVHLFEFLAPIVVYV